MIRHAAPLDLGLHLPAAGLPGGTPAARPVRWAEVQRVRRAIAAGAYEAPEVWEVVLERLSEALAR